jgi:hypothetical protein
MAATASVRVYFLKALVEKARGSIGAALYL